MVGHQTVVIDSTAQLLFPFPQIVEVVLVIRVLCKKGLPFMPPLNHMMREARENVSGSMGNGKAG